MRVDYIDIRNLRIFERAEFSPGPGINWICGDNGAGKTSILEAVYMLGRGRSFRRARVEPVVRRGAGQIRLVARGRRSNGADWTIGLERKGASALIRMDRENVQRMSDIARGFPIQVIAPNTYEILERGPSYRRRLLDWAVFHVEHQYQETFTRYERCLRQRNAALRQGEKTFRFWDADLGRAGETIQRARRRFITLLQEEFGALSDEETRASEISIDYRQGWPEEQSLASTLESNARSDARRGFTHSGPHRADLVLQQRGKPVAEVLSRGELKRLVLRFQLALGSTIEALCGERSIVLVDDLPAELDRANRAWALGLMLNTGCQAFVTAIEPWDKTIISADEARMFHVEHGTITQVAI